jgi:hypothetical protein
MDPFQTLPLEVMENILKIIPNLPYLRSLHNASPLAASLLHEKVTLAVVFEAILSHLAHHFRFLICTIIHLRTFPTTSGNNLLPIDYDTFTNPFSQRFHANLLIPRG